MIESDFRDVGLNDEVMNGLESMEFNDEVIEELLNEEIYSHSIDSNNLFKNLDDALSHKKRHNLSITKTAIYYSLISKDPGSVIYIDITKNIEEIKRDIYLNLVFIIKGKFISKLRNSSNVQLN